MADGIITPCNVARSWHWFRQVTDCTLQCGMWLWNHDREFTNWQHPAMWYVALGWHTLNSRGGSTCNVTHSSGIMTLNSPGGSTLQCGMWLWDDMPWNSPKRPPYWNSTSGSDFDNITAVDMSFCTSLRYFIQIGPQLAGKMASRRFSRWLISAILDFKDPIMGSLKSRCTTSYRSSIETIALNCLVFWENRMFAIWRQTDRQTNKHTNKEKNRWTRLLREAALAVASDGLTNKNVLATSLIWFRN